MRVGKLSREKAELEKKIRLNDESEERIKLITEQKDALEEEFDIIKKRLENWDNLFKWENSIYQKIANIIKRAQVSPKQAFEHFDQNGDGVLSKAEMQRALFEDLLIQDLTMREFEILWDSLDTDKSGTIDYREFIRKLEQYGVKNLGKEEFILMQMIKACKSKNISMSEFFQVIDKNQRGYITREDFKDIITNLDLKINEAEQNAFIDNFWRDKTAGIDYKGFLKIFAKLELQVDQSKRATNTRNQSLIKDETVITKKRIFDQINEVLKADGHTLADVFRAVDKDSSFGIDTDELFGAFKAMHIEVTRI